MLSKISKLKIELAPLKESSRSAKELLARVLAPKARASNPDCEVETKIKTGGESSVEVEFSNKHKETIVTGGQTVAQILRKIEEVSQVLEAQDVLKKVGMSGSQLVADTTANSHKSSQSRRVPIT